MKKNSNQIILFHFLRYILTLSLIITFFTCKAYPSYAATDESRKAIYDIVLNMLETNTSVSPNISSYKMTKAEVESIVMQVFEDNLVLVHSYSPDMLPWVRTSGKTAVGISLLYMNDDGAETFPLLEEAYDNIKAGIDSSMTDLDKIIYLHDSVVDYAVYKNTGNDRIFTTAGALVDKQAVCKGYAYALKLLLNSEGIEAAYVKQKVTMNHGWLYVKLDGEWYHIDPTWDDTLKGRTDSTKHHYLLCNDDYFALDKVKSHGEYVWTIDDTSSKSKSTRFDNWFVHDVKDKMLFKDGYWYYVDVNTNCLMRSQADGSDMLVVLDGSSLSTITLASISGDSLKYKCDSKYQTLKISEIERVEEIAVSESISSDLDNILEEIILDEVIMEDVNTPVTIPIIKDIALNDTAIYWNNISEWRDGEYKYSSGQFREYNGRLCLPDYLACSPNTEYKVIVKNTDFRMLIREMNSDKQLISSHQLADGGSFTTDSACAYLGITIYNKAMDQNYTRSDFESVFGKSDFIVGLDNYYRTGSSSIEDNILEDAKSDSMRIENLIPNINIEIPPVDIQNSTESIQDVITPDTVETVVVPREPSTWYWNSLDSWRIGVYDYTSGRYKESQSNRICLNDYIEVIPNQTYTVVLTNDSVRLVVRELNANMEVIKSHNKKAGQVITTDNECKFLAIGLYFPSNDSNSTYEDYVALFADDSIQIGLIEQSIEITEDLSPLGQFKNLNASVILIIPLLALAVIILTLLVFTIRQHRNYR